VLDLLQDWGVADSCSPPVSPLWLLRFIPFKRLSGMMRPKTV